MGDQRRRPVVAAAMSLVVPGAGQFYAGSAIVGAFWLAMAVAFWYADQVILALSSHALASVSAYWAVQRLTLTGRGHAHRPRRRSRPAPR